MTKKRIMNNIQLNIDKRFQLFENNFETSKILSDNSFDIINILDKNGKILFESVATERILGYRAGERIGKVAFEFVHPDDIQKIATEFQKLISEPKKQVVVEFRFKHQDGSWKWLETSGQNFIENPNIQGIIINSRDITERKQAEKQLSDRINFEKAISKCSTILLSNSSDAVYASLKNIIDISNACRVYIFKNFYDETNDLCMRQIYEICAEGINPEIDNPVLQKVSYKKDGFSRWEETLSKNKKILGNIIDFPENERNILEPQNIKSILIFPIFTNNQWFGFIGFDFTKEVQIWSDWDIYLLKTASELLGFYFQNKCNLSKITKQNDELQKLNDDKDTFMRILAHDLKNPFNSLLGFSELLLKNIRKYSLEKIENQLKIINQTSNQTYILLDDLLLWSKSQSGKLTFNPQNIDFEIFCNELLNNFQISANVKNLKLECNNHKFCLFADENMFKTIMRNLISNAIKFTNSDGTITINAEKQENKIIITVADTGIGISETEQEKMWNLPHHFSKNGTNGETGTGLGLILCKDFVEKHKGKIWVESVVGKGSDFKFTIPLCND